jgi:hypothetical protein
LNQRSVILRARTNERGEAHFVLEQLSSDIVAYQKMKALYEARFADLCQHDRQLKRLTRVEGIGTISAVKILATAAPVSTGRTVAWSRTPSPVAAATGSVRHTITARSKASTRSRPYGDTARYMSTQQLDRSQDGTGQCVAPDRALPGPGHLRHAQNQYHTIRFAGGPQTPHETRSPKKTPVRPAITEHTSVAGISRVGERPQSLRC